MNTENGAANVFVAALSKPTISEKCCDLEKLIDESSIKLLHQNFTILVQHIFGNNTPGWGIQSINPRQQPLDCHVLKDFFGSRGPMIRLIHKLQAESMLFRYDFPCSMLPPAFVHAPGEQIPSQQRVLRKIQNISFGATQFTTGSSNLKGQTCIRVSAFEFYFYHFAYCIMNTSVPATPQQNYYSYHQIPPSPDENLYYLLVDDYLSYFLPLDGSCPPTMQIPNANTQTGVRSTSWSPHLSSMLRKTATKQASSLGVTQNELWRSDLLLHILVEFWLGQCGTQKDGRSALHPSEDLIRAVRRLVKHLHHFASVNSSTFVHTPLNDSLMNQFKHNIMYNCLQPRLYEFLSYCFDVWPLNNTFRIVLETWLSFIQPWRYTDTSSGGYNSEMRLSNDREIANMWYHFISSNLHFYNKFFHDSINRFLRMDISKQANSLLLYRVAKIFGQPNLIQMIEEAEVALYGGDRTLGYPQSSGSYIVSARTPDITMANPAHLISSEEIRAMINQLLIVCQQALGTVAKNTSHQSLDWTSRLLNFIGLGSLAEVGSGAVSDSSWKKSEQQIKDSIETFAEIFDLAVPELDISLHWQSHMENPLGPDAPDCSVDEDGKVHLSDLGRYEMMNNIKKLRVLPNCEPELRPICSYENASLVRIFYGVSTAINKKYSSKFEELCSRTDFLGKIMTYYLGPQQATSPSANNEASAPRLSLRFLAHYRTLFYLGFYIVLCKLCGTSFVSALFYLLLFCLFYMLLKVFVLEWKSKSA